MRSDTRVSWRSRFIARPQPSLPSRTAWRQIEEPATDGHHHRRAPCPRRPPARLLGSGSAAAGASGCTVSRAQLELRALVVVSERARKEAAGCKPPCAESDTEQPCACTSCHHSSLVRVRVTDAPGHIYSKFSSNEKETPPRNFPPCTLL